MLDTGIGEKECTQTVAIFGLSNSHLETKKSIVERKG